MFSGAGTAGRITLAVPNPGPMADPAMIREIGAGLVGLPQATLMTKTAVLPFHRDHRGSVL